MKEYIADKGKTFINKEGVDCGNIIITSNIEDYTQIEIESPIKTPKSLKNDLIKKYNMYKVKNQSKSE